MKINKYAIRRIGYKVKFNLNGAISCAITGALSGAVLGTYIGSNWEKSSCPTGGYNLCGLDNLGNALVGLVAGGITTGIGGFIIGARRTKRIRVNDLPMY